MKFHDHVLPFAGCFATDPEPLKNRRFAFIGLPYDWQSSYRTGCARGPEQIRRAYDGHCYNPTTESGVDLSGAVADVGDLPSRSCWDSTAQSYHARAAALFRAGKIPFFAGGDHAVTIPIGEALSVIGDPIHIVQIDAHPDLYPEFRGNPHSHGCVAARLLEMNHIASLTQIGIRTLNQTQSPQVERFGNRLRMYLARDLLGDMEHPPHIPDGAPVYLTIDLDGFDPAFAPGVSHPVPGGLSARQVLNFIQTARWKLVGMDVVELNPELDINDQTAILAARLLHEGMGYAISG